MIQPPAPQEFRNALARWATTVHVVSTNGPAGLYGFTASAVCPVTDDPPALMVCINHTRGRDMIFRQNGQLRINTLIPDQQYIADIFAGRAGISGEQRFTAGGIWDLAAAHGPALKGALMSFACTLVSFTPVGTHTVMVCAVQSIMNPEKGQPLIYASRKYRTFI
jgi:flavin reductase